MTKEMAGKRARKGVRQKKRGPTPRRRTSPREPRTVPGLVWAFALSLAVVGLSSLLTGWPEWSAWIPVLLLLPVGVLPLLYLDRLEGFLELGDGAFGGGGGGDGGGDGGG